jgi:hypothetical protein
VVVATAVMAVAAIAAPSSVRAAVDPVIQVSNLFTTQTPGAATGQVFTMTIDAPGDATAKPLPLVREVLQLPPGARFDPSAIPQCDDSNPQSLMLALLTQPDSACPQGSHLGLDHATLDTGLPGSGQPRYILADVDEYNARGSGGDEVVFLARDPQSHQPTTVFYGRVTADTLDVSVPFVPGVPPDLRASDRGEHQALPALGNYRTTPPTCPPSGQWVSTSIFYFATSPTDTNGSLQETVHSTTPCTVSNAVQSQPSSPVPSGAGQGSGGTSTAGGRIGTPNTGAEPAPDLGGSAFAAAALGGVLALGIRRRHRRSPR